VNTAEVRADTRHLRVQQLGWALPVPPHAAAQAPRRWVLRGLDLDLPAGSQSVLVGPSGSGKSTLLYLLCGLATPHEGRVDFDGQPVSNWSARRRDAWRRCHVGLVFQQFHLFAPMSALDNVLLPWTLDHLHLPAQAIDDAHHLLERLKVPARQSCGSLSRGEQQRVALARALIRRPALVLADEPTASLDAERARLACDLLQRLCAAQGATLVMATHDQALAARFEQRIVLHGAR